MLNENQRPLGIPRDSIRSQSALESDARNDGQNEAVTVGILREQEAGKLGQRS